MEFEKMRQKMVDDQIIDRGITDKRVTDVMRRLPREAFVLPEDQSLAYQDGPLSIGDDQTISQPYIVALMTQSLELKPTDKVLEIGTGSGYQTAILAALAGQVHTIERHPKLHRKAKETLGALGISNVHFHLGDGTEGIKDEAKLFDAIMVTAAMPQELEHFYPMLTEAGRMLAPIGPRDAQMLTLFTKKGAAIVKKEICRCKFVPLIGKYGWHETKPFRF